MSSQRERASKIWKERVEEKREPNVPATRDNVRATKSLPNLQDGTSPLVTSPRHQLALRGLRTLWQG
ncbi:hypothetical protein OCU04_011412 [Sclerotinia nivalis]|uniref:Uncharacterized protein n=1 Tax=Sclerotinia nivalis TaxID=352851 RepID=A0A9X0ABF2_9HELO|nr:hypothetical protein OCU04_011412 [Sclerotinia nivalis]